jgi:hemerythrin-like domain-containing protein
MPPAEPLTSEHRSALEGALRYFAVAAPKHTADEEISLFPRLRESADPAVEQALKSLERLEEDHDVAETHHAAVDRLVRQWLEKNGLSSAETEDLRGHLSRLQTLYHPHIAIEDQEVLPTAARVLDRAQVQAIGGEMAARRLVRLVSS